jgi:hypothetical protein
MIYKDTSMKNLFLYSVFWASKYANLIVNTVDISAQLCDAQ